MQRPIRLIAAVALAGGGLVAAADPPVGAAGLEPLRLGCEARVADDSAVVRCEWSSPSSGGVAGLRLWRLDAAVDTERQVILRTDDTMLTTHTDMAVRRGHRYTYAIQAVTADGRVVAQSRAERVGVPASPAVEVLPLECELGPAGEAVGCAWRPPRSPDAHVVELWRSVDGAARELVDRFRPEGPTAHRDAAPDGAASVTYAVLVRDDTGELVGRSRPEHVALAQEAAAP